MHPHTRTLLLVVLLLLPGLGRAGTAAQDDPGVAARRELAAIARLTPDPQRGRGLFMRCGTCHDARDPSLPKGWVPSIAGQHARVIVKELLDYRHGLRWDKRMEVVAGQHVLGSDQEIADLAAYAQATPRPQAATGSGEHLERGRKLYRAQCVACHGPAGAGSNVRVIPQLAGQDYEYLLRQLHDALEGRRPTLSGHARLLEPLDASELEGLADYLSRLTPGKGAEPPKAITARM
jgi:cytochrome c553